MQRELVVRSPSPREEVLTLSGEDADNLQDLLSSAGVVHFDVGRRVLMFGTTKVGSA